ncbi:hypothetical protein [Terriglobus tenax]|uniref:hypothetical protein n=1 Tax=Terriglobus tenax TaxID=1111115 RepID=UPI0021DFEF23|nr:hypothetical protein [Terriglobus tenax]
MGLDIRFPLGLMFLVTGGLMTVYGFFTRGSAIYQKSLGDNLNLQWGLVMFVFGAVMLYFGKRQSWKNDPVNPRPWERPGYPR